MDVNRDKVNAFLKSINIQSYGEKLEICGYDELKCPLSSSMCAGDAESYYCQCRDGYKPNGGDEINNKEGCVVDLNYTYTCKDTDCNFPSTKCQAEGKSFYCKCDEGFRPKDGKLLKDNKEACEVDPDYTYTCKATDCNFPSTKCQAEGNSFYCMCDEGFRPKDGKPLKENKEACEVDPNYTYTCKATDCNFPSTKCQAEGKSFYCKCDEGFRPKDGKLFKDNKEACEVVTHVCKDTDCKGENTKCVVADNYYTCDCKDGFIPKDDTKKGQKDNVCVEEEKCGCGVYSTACKRDEDGKPVCDCVDGYAQYRDVCLDCYCGQHSLSCSFDDIGHKTCQCITGYAHRNVTCSAMCKSNIDCLNGGICRYERKGYFCSCKEHYRGDRCEINDVCDSMMETCDAIGAVCIYNELLRKGFCECPPSRTFNRKLKTCEDKLEWNIVFAVLLSAIIFFIIIMFCILMTRQFKTSDKHYQCKKATMMETS